MNSINLNSFMQSIAYSVTFCTTSLSVSFNVGCTEYSFIAVNFFNGISISIRSSPIPSQLGKGIVSCVRLGKVLIFWQRFWYEYIS
ncbi:hypothetical protein FGO68_gene5118 [Halteria grandinella]|uniref:Uncharacterized protein n=1 Tax=Halteria grandinella TaxID=5974 RepID=A0A8J8NDD6_HALGN|nr:hypothetical protein FGO68_gene5118 [Halteria grandinella]